MCKVLFWHRDVFSGSLPFVKNQLNKSDDIRGFQLGNQRLITAIHRAFEFRSRMQIWLIECNLAIVSQPSKCLKFMTFREGCLSYAIECKYLSEALKTFYQH